MGNEPQGRFETRALGELDRRLNQMPTYWGIRRVQLGNILLLALDTLLLDADIGIAGP